MEFTLKVVQVTNCKNKNRTELKYDLAARSAQTSTSMIYSPWPHTVLYKTNLLNIFATEECICQHDITFTIRCHFLQLHGHQPPEWYVFLRVHFDQTAT